MSAPPEHTQPDGNRRLTPSFRPQQQPKTPPCHVGCATSGDVRGWIGLVAQRRKMGLSRPQAYERAWSLITEVNPFPSVMGRVCPHPCEEHCNRGEVDEAVSINAMERFLGDWALEAGLALPRPAAPMRPGHSIGVVGAGPSGLSFAYQMRRRGYPVTVYELHDRPGGMLRYGIPDYRLPPAVLDAEIDRILALGVELRCNVRIGRDVSLDTLRQRHAALFLGIGAQTGRRIGFPGEDGPGTWSGTEYLARVNRGEPVPLGRRVLVLGGGNTAVDAARAARRQQAHVTLVYRRSRHEMPAIAHEVDEALEEGVELLQLTAPVRLERRDGIPHMLVVQTMELGDADASGRRRPLPVAGAEFSLRVDSIVSAVSQQADFTGLEQLADDNGWPLTDGQGMLADAVWAGGDVLGPGIAGFAIAQGRRAAEAVHARLSGQPRGGDTAGTGPQIGLERIHAHLHERTRAARGDHLSAAARLADGGSEVTGRLDEAAFLAEADRCFSCGSCFGCQHCAMFCTVGGFIRLDEVQPGSYYALSLDACEECGKCVEVCPCGFLDVRCPPHDA